MLLSLNNQSHGISDYNFYIMRAITYASSVVYLVSVQT